MPYNEMLFDYLREKDLYSNELRDAILSFHDIWKEEQSKKDYEDFTWGKYKGKSIEHIMEVDKGYCIWMLGQKYCSKGIKNKIVELLQSNKS